MIPVQTALVNSAIRTQVDLERFSVGVTEKVEKLLSIAQTEIIKALVETDPTARPLTEWKRKRLEELNGQINGILQDYYAKIDKGVTESLVGIAKHQMDATTGTVRNVFGANLFNVTLTEENLKAIVSNTLIDGATIKQWWDGKPEAYRQKFQRAMQAGMQQIELGQVKGESIGELIRRIRGTKDTPGVMDVAKHEAAALVRTSVMQVAQGVRRGIYEANADVIKGLQVVATLDMRTTPLCRALDGTQYDLDGNPLDGGNRPMPPGPPFHWNCRSTLVPIFKPYSELVKTKGKLSGEKLDELEKIPVTTRSSMRGQVPDTLDYNEWLKTQPEAIQKEVLGEARWDLWNTGKLTMADMVHQNGRPLTLPELERKVALYDERKAAEIARREAEAQIKTLEDQWKARMAAPGEVVTFTKGESLPETMFPYATSVDTTAYRKEVAELPALAAEAGKKRAAGIIMVEDDGKVWIVRPTGKYGGIEATFPKGRFTGEILEGALRETWEETGFQAEITGFLGDYSRRATKTRYYIGRRIGGSPMAMGAESEAIVLGPVDKIRAILNMDVDKAIADDLARHIQQATAAGEGDLHKGLQRLVKDATFKAKFDDIMASPEVLFDLKLSPEQIPAELTWENKLRMVEARLDAMAKGKIDVWLTRAGTAEYDVLASVKMEGRESLAVYREVAERAEKVRESATAWLKAEAEPGTLKAAAKARAGTDIEGMDPYLAQKEVQRHIVTLQTEADETIAGIVKAIKDGRISVETRAYTRVRLDPKIRGSWDILKKTEQYTLEMRTEGERYFADLRRMYAEPRFIEVQNELAKLNPEYHSLDIYSQMQFCKERFGKILTWTGELEAILESSTKLRTLYIEKVDMTLPVEMRLEEMKRLKATFKEWAAEAPHPDSVPTAGKLMKDYTASEAASIYGTLRKSLIAGKVPKGTTAIMRRWEELAAAERKRVIDMWLAKGTTIPEDFLKKYYVAAEAPAPAAAAAKKAKGAAAAPTPPPKPIPTTGGKVIQYKLDDFREYAPKEGSNPGGFFHNKANPADRFYFKFPDDEMKIYNEVLASRLYRAAGVEVPELGIVEGATGQKGVASRLIDGIEKSEAKLVSGKVTGIKENFVVDAWLANWDVVGGVYDNLVIQGGTKAVRVDVGGSLLFRARGGLKGAAFGDEVGELHSLLDARKNAQSAKVFGGITNAEMKAGAAKVIRMTDADINRIVDEVIPLKHSATRTRLKDTLRARREYIREYFAEAPIARAEAPLPAPPLHSLQTRTIDVAIQRGKVTPQGRRDLIKQFKSKEGLQLTEEQVQTIEKKFAEQIRICTNIPIEDGPTSDVYKNLMKDPELKNQFTRGRNGGSRGAHGPYKGSSRDSWERTLSDGILQTDETYMKMKHRAYFEGLDRQAAARRRPYYGFVWDNSYTYGDNPAGQYGDLTCFFKNYKRDQATFTMGNSSGLSGRENENHGHAKSPMPILSRTMSGTTNRWTKNEVQAILDGKKTVNQVGFKRGSYTEAQIYGELRLDRDVEYMVWHGDSIPDYVKKFADRYGVPIYKVRQYKAMLANGTIT